jgi:hypothetical protein
VSTYPPETTAPVSPALTGERTLVVDYLDEQAKAWNDQAVGETEDEARKERLRGIASALSVNAEKIRRGWHDPATPPEALTD